MSTLKATNIKNVSSGTNNLVLGENGGVVISGLATVSNANVTGGTITGVSTVGVTTLTVSNANITGGSITGVSTVSSTAFSVNGNAYPSAGPLSNRNLIINGAMRVAQRGTSASVSDGTNEGYQTLDRFAFLFGASADGAATISQSTTVPSGQGFSNSYKVDVTTTNTPSGTENIFIRYEIEAQDLANSGWNYTSASSYITVSFWARSSKAGTYCLWLNMQDTTTNEYYVAEYTLVANTWKKVEINIPGHSNAVINNDNGSGLELDWVLASNQTGATAGVWSDTADRATSNQVNVFDSTDGEFYLTGVQLEVGSVATPFEHRSYGDELNRCYRYYQNSFASGNEPGVSVAGADAVITTSWADGNAPFPQFALPMRTTPNVTLRARGETTTGQVENGGTDRSASAQEVNEKNVGYISITSGTGGQFNAFTFELDAEL